MKTDHFRYPAVVLAVLLSGTMLSTKCFAQGKNFEETMGIFSDADNQKKLPAKQNQKPKASEKQAPIGNCGQGEWAQCDYDGINN